MLLLRYTDKDFNDSLSLWGAVASRTLLCQFSFMFKNVYLLSNVGPCCKRKPWTFVAVCWFMSREMCFSRNMKSKNTKRGLLYGAEEEFGARATANPSCVCLSHTNRQMFGWMCVTVCYTSQPQILVLIQSREFQQWMWFDSWQRLKTQSCALHL